MYALRQDVYLYLVICFLNAIPVNFIWVLRASAVHKFTFELYVRIFLSD